MNDKIAEVEHILLSEVTEERKAEELCDEVTKEEAEEEITTVASFDISPVHKDDETNEKSISIVEDSIDEIENSRVNGIADIKAKESAVTEESENANDKIAEVEHLCDDVSKEEGEKELVATTLVSVVNETTELEKNDVSDISENKSCGNTQESIAVTIEKELSKDAGGAGEVEFSQLTVDDGKESTCTIDVAIDSIDSHTNVGTPAASETCPRESIEKVMPGELEGNESGIKESCIDNVVIKSEQVSLTTIEPAKSLEDNKIDDFVINPRMNFESTEDGSDDSSSHEQDKFAIAEDSNDWDDKQYDEFTIQRGIIPQECDETVVHSNRTVATTLVPIHPIKDVTSFEYQGNSACNLLAAMDCDDATESIGEVGNMVSMCISNFTNRPVTKKALQLLLHQLNGKRK